MEREEIIELIDKGIVALPAQVKAYREGSTNRAALFVGMIMKASKGTIDPQLLKELVIERLNG